MAFPVFSTENFEISSDWLVQISSSFLIGPYSLQSARNLYQSCMDEDLIEESSMEDARDILEQLGGWPVLLADTWEAENFTWYGLAEKANLLGFDTSRILSASEFSH